MDNLMEADRSINNYMVEHGQELLGDFRVKFLETVRLGNIVDRMIYLCEFVYANHTHLSDELKLVAANLAKFCAGHSGYGPYHGYETGRGEGIANVLLGSSEEGPEAKAEFMVSLDVDTETEN